MAEPLPSQSQSTAQLDADDVPPAITNAEDRKAAAALSSLDARGDDDDEYDNGKAGGGKGVNNNIDQEALGRAISRLEISAGGGGGGGGGKGGGGGGGGEKATEGKDGGDRSGNKGKGKELEALKKVKVDQNDVALLVS